MQLSTFRKQDGFVRETIKYFALIVVIMVMVLDTIAVAQVQLTVRDNATVAASDAHDQYVQGSTWPQSQQVAASYVEAKGSRFISASMSGAADRQSTVISVTAERGAHTYVYHYFTKLPWGLGDRVDNLLNPTATGISP